MGPADDRSRAERASTRGPKRATGDPNDRRALGAAAGLLGFGGAFAWLRRGSTREAIAGVRPGTWRGALLVIAWLAGVVAIGLVGRLVAPGLGVIWLLIALAVMLPIAGWWSRRRADAGR